MDKNHICYGCAFNINNKRCADIKEFDAQCDTCGFRNICLNNNPVGDDNNG